jgi:hypothetical protein
MSTLTWWFGSNGNEFADGPRPKCTEKTVRYCIVYPSTRYSDGMTRLLCDGNEIGKFFDADAAKSFAEFEANATA